MMMSNGNMRSSYPEPKKEEVKEELKHEELETTNLSSDSMTDIAKMVASMLETVAPSVGYRELDDRFHELDKRIAVLEALVHHINK